VDALGEGLAWVDREVEAVASVGASVQPRSVVARAIERVARGRVEEIT
jgi:hypothetical protein